MAELVNIYDAKTLLITPGGPRYRRMLLVQARDEQTSIVSGDRIFARYGTPVIGDTA